MDEIRKIAAVAKQIFLRDGYHAPIVVAKGTNGSQVILMEQFGRTADERAKDMFFAGELLAKRSNIGDLELIVFVCEGWMGTNINVLPSQDPQHIEVLLVNSLDARTKKEEMQAMEIKRDPKGSVVDLKDLPLPESSEAKGMLLPAFQKGYQTVSPVHN